MKLWWNDYVGIPYQPKGRTRDGADCWGLVRMVYADQFDTELPSLADEYEHEDDAGIAQLVAMRKESWVPVDQPRPGDVVVFRVLGQPTHVGVAAAPGTFLHSREGYASTIERLDSGAWKHRVDGFFRYEAKPQLNAITLAACPHPLRTERIDGMMPSGMSLAAIDAEIRKRAGINAAMDVRIIMMVDGKPVPAELWTTTVPAVGARVEYRAVPGKNAARALLSLAVVIAAVIIAPYLAPYIGTTLGVSTAVATAVATAALTFAGTMLLNAVYPIRTPGVDQGTDPGQAARQNLLQGGSNRANPYGAIPVVLGQFRYTPPVGAINYVEADATTSYLRMLLVWGYGPLQVTDLRVGETPISSLEECEIETVNGYANDDKTRLNVLYGRDVVQESVNIKLERPLRTVVSATRASNVVTVVTAEDHGYAVGWLAQLQGQAEAAITTIVDNRTFRFTLAGANGGISAAWVAAGVWTERVIDEEVNRITVTLHFPEGLRTLQTDGNGAGAITEAPFIGVIQVRKVDSNTLAPLTGWYSPTDTVLSQTINLPSVWYPVDLSDPEGGFFRSMQPAWQWHRICVDKNNNIVVRSGAPTADVSNDPSGAILDWLRENATGLNPEFKRLPNLQPGDTELWQVYVNGDSIQGFVDRRYLSGATVNQCGITTSGLTATISAGTVTRFNGDTVTLGAAGQAYFKRKDAFTYNVSFNLDPGMYEVRARRLNDSVNDVVSGGVNFRKYHDVYLSNITGYSNRRPVVEPKPLAMTAIRVRASNQINGSVDGISATVLSICKDWDSATSTWVDRPTRNPASLLRYVLQHPANAKAVPDSELDLDALVDWHNFCRVNSFTFDAVVSSQRSLLEVLRDIAAAGRASPTMRDGKWTVVIDRPRSTLAQFFTPHNSWGFEGTRTLPNLPHGFRVQFNNARKGYQPDERIIYNDGYNASNATLFEGLTLPGVTDPDQVYRAARFHLAQLKLRPETYTLNADIEHLICTRGDLVRVTHDVPMWGLGTGRIKEFVSGTVLKLDEQVPMDAGVQYTIRIRGEDGTSVTRTVAAAVADGHYDTITLTSSVTSTQGAEGNLFMFGALSEESVELVVLGIEPAENMSARLTLVDYSPDVYTADSGAIPAFDSQITLPPTLQQSVIPVGPSITSIVSDESVMVRLSQSQFGYRIKVSFVAPRISLFNATRRIPPGVKYVEGQIDFAEDAALEWQTTKTVPATASSIFFDDVQEGDVYRMRLRYVTEDGRVGPWVNTDNHTVVGKTNPPTVPTGLSFTVSGQQLLVDWNNNPEVDVVAYEVRLGFDEGWGVDNDYVFRGAASQFVMAPPAPGQQVGVLVRAVDAAGLYSTTSAILIFSAALVPNIVSISETFADTSLTNATITLDWPSVTPQFGLGGYRVSYGSVSKIVNANTITLPADWLGSRTFTVQTIDANGNLSSGTSKTITKLPPNPATNFRAQVIDNNVLLFWDLPAKTTLPIQHVLLKQGATWATATTIGTKDGAFTTIQELASGTYTYWISVVDTDNNESTPVSVSAKVSEPPDFVFHGEFTSAFAGTKSSSIVEDGTVVMPVNTTETWTTHFTARGWNTPQDQINAGFPIFIQPANGTGFYQEVFDFGAQLSSSQITVAYTGDTISGSPTVRVTIATSDDNVTYSSDNIGTSAFATNFRYVRVRITVTESTGTGLYRLTSLNARLDAKLKNDAGYLSAVSTDTSGTVANFSKEFIDITSITLTPAGTSAATAVYNFQDATISGTYSVTSNVATINCTAHDLAVGQKVRLSFSSGTAPSGVYTVASVTNANTFTVSMTTANTSGNCSMYPQGFRVYLFNSSGTRVSGTVSWSVKGY